MKASITIRDTNNIERLKKDLQKLGRSTLKVGVFGGEKQEGADIDLVDLASIHEYGCEIPVTPKMRAWFAYNGYPLKKSTTVIRIPERSFIRSGFDENVDKIADKVQEVIPSVLESEVDPDIFMNAIGLEFAGLIQKKLRSIQDPPNSQMTIDRKGSSNPLQDTGQLVESIRHEVE